MIIFKTQHICPNQQSQGKHEFQEGKSINIMASGRTKAAIVSLMVTCLVGFRGLSHDCSSPKPSGVRRAGIPLRCWRSRFVRRTEWYACYFTNVAKPTNRTNVRYNLGLTASVGLGLRSKINRRSLTKWGEVAIWKCIVAHQDKKLESITQNVPERKSAKFNIRKQPNDGQTVQRR